MNDLEELLLQHVFGNSEERCAARRILGPLISENESALGELMKTGNAKLRRAISAAVSLLQSPRTRTEVLGNALADNDSLVLAEACWAVEELGSNDCDWWEQIARLLGHDDWHVRQAALNAAGACAFGDPTRISVIGVCIDDPVWQVRDALAEALGKASTWNESVANLLARLFGDPEPEVRKTAAGIVDLLNPDVRVVGNSLVRLLSDVSWDVRTKACEVIRGYGAAAAFAIPALRRNVNVSNMELRQAATRALSEIEGKI